ARHAVGIRKRDRFARQSRERNSDRTRAAGINPVRVTQKAVDRMCKPRPPELPRSLRAQPGFSRQAAWQVVRLEVPFPGRPDFVQDALGFVLRERADIAKRPALRIVIMGQVGWESSHSISLRY